MKSLPYLILYILAQNSVNSEKPFKSIPVTVKTYENDTVLLPCYMDEMGKFKNNIIYFFSITR